MNVVVAGATGFVGSALVRELSKRGDSVLVLTRNPQGRPMSRLTTLRGVTALGWNAQPSTDAAFIAAVGAADAVVNLAGASLFAKRWTPEWKRQIHDSRVISTRALVEAMEATSRSPLALVNASGVGIYGSRGDELLDESAPPGDDFLARLCVDWEAEAVRAEEQGVRVVCLRQGIVLDGDGGALQQLMRPFRFFVGGPLGTGRQWMSWIDRADLVRLILFAIDHPTLSGPVNAVSPDPRRNADFSRVLGKTLGRPSWLPVPSFALRLALGEFGETLVHGQRAFPKAALEQGFAFERGRLEESLEALVGQSSNAAIGTGSAARNR